MRSSLVYISLMLLVLTSCKKQPLPDLPEETGPYYSIKGYMDGEQLHLNVGQEGIQISQGTTENNGVLSYYGQIISPTEDILIRVEFTRPEKPINAGGLNAIDLGNIGFMVHQEGCLTPNFGGNLTQGNFLLIKNESGVFEPLTSLVFDEYGIYDVTMKFTDVGQNSFQLPVKYGYHNNELDPTFQTTGIIDSIIFSSNATGVSHEWYVDNNLISNEEVFTASLPIGIHKVQHVIHDQYYNESTHTTLLRVTDYLLDWQLSLNGCSGPVNTSSYGKVTISVQKDGQLYTSDKTAINLLNNFSVSNIEYVGNSSYEPVRAVFDLAFDAMLVNESGSDSLSLSAMSGTFNVGLQ